MATPPKMAWHPKDQLIAGTIEIDPTDDLFTRPPRNPDAVLPTLATTEITCRVCGATVSMPILHPGLLCYQCERNPQKAMEAAYAQWEQAQLRALDEVNTRYLNVVQARYEVSTGVLTRFLQQARKPKQDRRQLGDSPRIKRLLVAIQAGHTNEAIIASEQARVRRGIDNAIAAGDGLAELLRAEQRYNDAVPAVEAVLGTDI